MRKFFILGAVSVALISIAALPAFAEDTAGSASRTVSGGEATVMCDYAAPPQGCAYVPGPNFDGGSRCGMVLECKTLPKAGPLPAATSTVARPVPLPFPARPIALPLPSVGGGTSIGSAIAVPISGVAIPAGEDGSCPDGFVVSVDRKSCLGVSVYGTLPSISASSSEGHEPGAAVPEASSIPLPAAVPLPATEARPAAVPSDGKCPAGYVPNPAGTVCVNAPIPTILISPASPVAPSVTFASGTIEVRSVEVPQATSIAPAEGFRVVLDAPEPVTVERAADNTVSISRNAVSASVAAGSDVRVASGTITVAGNPIAVMPDAAASAAASALGTNVGSVTLSAQNGGATYSVNGLKTLKVLGVLPVQVPVVANVNAQTAAVEAVQGPWWSFIAW